MGLFREISHNNDQTNDASHLLSRDANPIGDKSQKVSDKTTGQADAGQNNQAERLAHLDKILGTVTGQQTVPEVQVAAAKQALDSFMFTAEQQNHPEHGAYCRETTQMVQKIYELANGDPVVALAKLRAMAKQG